MTSSSDAAVRAEKNQWRLDTPGSDSWGTQLDPGSPDKFFVVTCDSHANETFDFLTSRVASRYHDRLPRVKTDDEGVQWLHTDGWTPQRVSVPADRVDLLPTLEEFEEYEVLAPYSKRMEDEDVKRASAGRNLAQRQQDRQSSGVDAEIIFPQKGQLCFATPDPDFSMEMCRAWNRWAVEEFATDWEASLPMAMIAPGSLRAAIDEVNWAADNGFHGVVFPNRPIFHRNDQPRNSLEYNDKTFEPLWHVLSETGLPVTFHVNTGQDPRAVGGNGAAITNFVCHSMQTTIEPVVTMISSGVFERHPGVKIATIESGVGWVPWVLTQMDHAYRAHHMWVRPVIPDLPSEYYRRNCYAAFLDEPEGVRRAVEYGLEDNLLWSNDYPHQEGCFPHERENIERNLDGLTTEQRRKILGGNAATLFRISNNT